MGLFEVLDDQTGAQALPEPHRSLTGRVHEDCLQKQANTFSIHDIHRRQESISLPDVKLHQPVSIKWGTAACKTMAIILEHEGPASNIIGRNEDVRNSRLTGALCAVNECSCPCIEWYRRPRLLQATSASRFKPQVYPPTAPPRTSSVHSHGICSKSPPKPIAIPDTQPAITVKTMGVDPSADLNGVDVQLALMSAAAHTCTWDSPNSIFPKLETFYWEDVELSFGRDCGKHTPPLTYKMICSVVSWWMDQILLWDTVPECIFWIVVQGQTSGYGLLQPREMNRLRTVNETIEPV